MAGGMRSGEGRSLAERSAGARAAPAPVEDEPDRPRPVVQRHCWVQGLPQAPGRWPALLVEWRRSGTAWEGRAVYVVAEGGAAVVVESWLPAAHLHPA
jgi:hypothetical protein